MKKLNEKAFYIFLSLNFCATNFSEEYESICPIYLAIEMINFRTKNICL